MRAILFGTVVGTVVLGLGGRVAMRIYALMDYQEPYFTASGTLTVVLIAAAAGAATGAWWWLAQRLFGARHGVRYLFFWAGLLLLSWRVLQPVSLQRVQVFAPLVAVHGLLVPFTSGRSVHRLPTADVVGLAGDGRRSG